VSLAERVGDRVIEGQAQYVLGELAIARGDNASAARHLERASTVFGEFGSALWQAKTLLLLSEVQESAGDIGQAGRSLDEAADLLNGMDSKESTALLNQVRDARSAMPVDGVVVPSRIVEA